MTSPQGEEARALERLERWLRETAGGDVELEFDAREGFMCVMWGHSRLTSNAPTLAAAISDALDRLSALSKAEAEERRGSPGTSAPGTEPQ